jgi:hypothetical protein
MLNFIGFVIVWPIACLFFAMIVNTARARNGTDVVDYFSLFMKGFTLGPFAILGSFSPQAQTKGTAAPLFWGGLVGTILASSLYLNSFA